MTRHIHAVLMTALLLMGSAFSVSAAPPMETSEGYQELGKRAEQLKKDLLDINRDLFILEEELLYPTNTRVAVFLSMNRGQFFSLDGLEIRMDGKVVSNQLYSEHQVNALKRGGVQQAYQGNIKAGKHEIIAFVTGKGPKGRDMRRALNLSFEKKSGPKYIELMILDSTKSQRPDFQIRAWD